MINKNNEKVSISRVFSNIKFVLNTIWQINPFYIVINFVFIFENIPRRLLNVLIVKYIVDEAVKGTDFVNIVVWGCLFLLFEIIITVIKHFFSFAYKQPAEEQIRLKLKQKMYDKIVEIDISNYDDTEFYNKYVRAFNASDTVIFSIFDDLLKFTGAFLSVGTLISIIIILSPPVIIVSIFSSFISLFSKIKMSKTKYMYEKEKIVIDRKINYINNLFYSRETSKDMRLEKLPVLANKIHNASSIEKINLAKKYGLKYAVLNILSESPLDMGDMFMWLYIAHGIIKGTMLAGNFMALSNAAWSLGQQLRNIFNALPNIFEGTLLIENLRVLSSKKSTLCIRGNKPVPFSKKYEINLHDVSFSYNSGQMVLENINLRFSTGQKIAIVGHNGAGKSTLIKLLLRLYDPVYGKISLNGINYNEYDLVDLRKIFSVVFQDFRHYAFTIAENVLMKTPESDDDRLKVWDTLKKVGMADKVNVLPLGIDTPVTKEFLDKGILFSGGELQKLSIARALIKETPVVLMDEPSSALDPIAEHEIEQMLAEIFTDKLVVIISHRLSLTKNADIIVLLVDGKIAEIGTHRELLALNKHYATMWNVQAEKYTLGGF
jgi:ATP-binding cassette subfamily B protein